MNRFFDIQLSQKDHYRKKMDHWEIIKQLVKETTIQFSARRQKSKRNQIQILERKLKYWQSQGEHNYFEKVEERVRELISEINRINAEKTKGAIMRCRQNWQEMAGKPTKYFLNLEKSNFNKKTLHKIRANGQIYTEQKDIRDKLTEYYRQLFTSKVKVDEEYLKEMDIPQTPVELHNELDEPIQMREISIALKELPSNKMPGIDGLSANFMKFFRLKLKHFIYELFLEIIEEKRFHLSARRGLISLLEKLGKDFLEIDNWRPISLLCTDFKIFSKVIALRLQKVLPSIIHRSQCGFMKGRKIGENTLKLMAMMNYCQQKKKSAAIISFDFRKAFDSVEWEAIYKAMETFGFGPRIIDYVKIMHYDMYSAVINNGYWGDWIKLQRSTRQGDPSSSLIFLLIAEIIGIRIRTNIKIKGIQIDQDEIKSEQFADDLWVVTAIQDYCITLTTRNSTQINTSRQCMLKLIRVNMD